MVENSLDTLAKAHTRVIGCCWPKKILN